VLGCYERSLRRALRWPGLVMLSLAATIVLAGYLFTIVPKGFFPQQDTGRMIGGIQADQSISFQLMEKKLAQFVNIIRHDPAVENVVAFTGGFQTNSGFVFVVLKPLSERNVSVMQVIGRLRPKLNHVAGARLFLQAVQDIWVGGRQSNAQYQYTLQGDDAKAIYEWAPKVEAALEKIPLINDVNLDQQQKGLESDLVIDRNTAARYKSRLSRRVNAMA
jgi:multidrug efflux pump